MRIMNSVLAAVVWLFQRVPLSCARAVGRVPGIRTLANRLSPDRVEVFTLAKPLEGHRMRLEWRSQKKFVFGTKEPAVVETIRRVVRPGQLVVDVGAHVGYFTLLLAKQVGPSGKVVAFEPNPRIFQILQENVALNGYRNVVLENKAVADRPGQVELRISAGSPFDGIDSIVADPGPGPRIEVEAVSLDDFFNSAGRPIGFVKVDIEGAETLALQGMSRILQEDGPCLLIELHGAEACTEEHPALLKLRGAQYTVSRLDGLGESAHVLAKPKHAGAYLQK